MWQRQPHRAQLKQAGRSRVEDPPRDIDVGNRVAVEENAAAMIIEYQRSDRDQTGDSGQREVIVAHRRVRWWRACSHHSICVSSRKTL